MLKVLYYPVQLIFELLCNYTDLFYVLVTYSCVAPCISYWCAFVYFISKYMSYIFHVLFFHLHCKFCFITDTSQLWFVFLILRLFLMCLFYFFTVTVEGKISLANCMHVFLLHNSKFPALGVIHLSMECVCMCVCASNTDTAPVTHTHTHSAQFTWY